MSYKIVQMCLRGFTLIMMLFGMYFNWECYDLTTTTHFIMSGVYGGFAVVTFGILIEAGLYLSSDKFVEASFLVTGIILNILCSLISFMEFYTINSYHNESISKGFVSMLSVVVYMIDMLLLFCT